MRLRREKQRRRPLEATRPDVQAKRRVFLRQVRGIPVAHLVFLDESGLHLAMSRSHTWVKRGTEYIDPVPMNWGTTLTLLGAIRVEGWVPFVIAMRERNDPAIAEISGRAPFVFFIETPFTSVALPIAVAVQKFQDPTPISMEQANARLVSVEVSPGPQFTTADAIEQVVIRRGDVIIRPIKADVVPRRVQNALGATRELTRGSFTFGFDAFAPSGAITIILVGARGNFEWTMPEVELLRIR